MVGSSGCQQSGNEPASPARGDSEGGAEIAALAGLDYAPDPLVHHDPDGRVRVELSSAWTDDGRLVVRGVFTPDDAGYHLYSHEMPMEGVHGLGRPTRLELADPEPFAEVGELVCDRRPLQKLDKNLNVTLPIYPDSPVTLYLPLRLKEAPTAPLQVPLQITYMSCSDMQCFSPVQQALEQLTVAPPAR
jgi:hypothetical protein